MSRMSPPAIAWPEPLLRRLERAGLEFAAEFHGRMVARHPDHVEALAHLATTLTLLGRLEEGLAADERLVALAPRDPVVHYNLACSLSLLGRKAHALDALERAVELGYRDGAHLGADEALAALHDEER